MRDQPIITSRVTTGLVLRGAHFRDAVRGVRSRHPERCDSSGVRQAGGRNICICSFARRSGPVATWIFRNAGQVIWIWREPTPLFMMRRHSGFLTLFSSTKAIALCRTACCRNARVAGV